MVISLQFDNDATLHIDFLSYILFQKSVFSCFSWDFAEFTHLVRLLVTNKINEMFSMWKSLLLQYIFALFQALTKKYFETKFAKINVDKAKYFVEKLKIRVLPAVLCFINGKVVDRYGLFHTGTCNYNTIYLYTNVY